MLLFVSLSFSCFRNLKFNTISTRHLICLEGKGKEHKNHCGCTAILYLFVSVVTLDVTICLFLREDEKDSSEIWM